MRRISMVGLVLCLCAMTGCPEQEPAIDQKAVKAEISQYTRFTVPDDATIVALEDGPPRDMAIVRRWVIESNEPVDPVDWGAPADALRVLGPSMGADLLKVCYPKADGKVLSYTIVSRLGTPFTDDMSVIETDEAWYVIIVFFQP